MLTMVTMMDRSVTVAPAITPAHGRVRVGLDLWTGVVLLLAVVLGVLAGPWIWPADPLDQHITSAMAPPGLRPAPGGAVHPLGTDELGRDLLARVIRGARISLMVVVLAAAISAVLGVAGGIAAGVSGGWLEILIMRLVDVQLSIPFVLLILLVVSVVGPGMTNLVVVMGVTGWAMYARVARGQVLAVRQLEFVEAARAMGAGSLAIMWRHVLPNILTPLVVLVTLDLPRLVILESAVGFLGLGIAPPTPTLGSLIGEGRHYMVVSWWLVVCPGAVIASLVLAFNLLGDGLVTRFNTRLE